MSKFVNPIDFLFSPSSANAFGVGDVVRYAYNTPATNTPRLADEGVITDVAEAGTREYHTDRFYYVEFDCMYGGDALVDAYGVNGWYASHELEIL